MSQSTGTCYPSAAMLLVGLPVASCLKFPASFLVVGVESWGWFFGLVRLVFLLDVGAVGVGWVFVRLAESSLWS